MAGQKCLRDNEPVLRRRKQAFSIPQTHHVRRKIHDGRIKLPGHCHADRHFAQSVHVAPLNALHQFTCAIGWLPRNMAWRTKRRRKQTKRNRSFFIWRPNAASNRPANVRVRHCAPDTYFEIASSCHSFTVLMRSRIQVNVTPWRVIALAAGRAKLAQTSGRDAEADQHSPSSLH